MSDFKKINMQQTALLVNELLSQPDIKLSVEYVDTYYIYGSDNKLLACLGKSGNNPDKVGYNITLSNINDKVLLQQHEIEPLYKHVDLMFKHGYVRPESNPLAAYTLQDMVHLYDNYKKSDKNLDKKDIIEKVILHLMKSNCPVDIIHKVIYYFHKGNMKKEFSAQFPILNHHAKLVEYKTPRSNQWFFTGENKSTGFFTMNAESQKIFDNVKIALQNQKHKVK